MNRSRSDLDDSSIKQDKETELIPSVLTFRMMFWICFYMFSCVRLLGLVGEVALLKAILLITILHLRFPGLTSIQLASARL